MAGGTKKPVSLRGVPPEVVREAKAQAARRGVSLAGFVADTLARALRGAAAPADDPLSDAMRWYERNSARLAREYPGEYVAILDRSVIDHDASFEALAERVFARSGSRDVYMPELGARRGPLRVRSPRLAGSVRRSQRRSSSAGGAGR